MDDKYEKSISKLAARVRLANEAKWSPTPSRKECKRVAKELEKVAKILESTSEAMLIESTHKRRGESETITGLDGWPLQERVDLEWSSYEGIKWIIRDLAASARLAADELPDPREKHALHHAALGMLHLRSWHGKKPATAYKNGEAVIELERIAKLAGIVLSREAYLKALKQARATFDFNYIPPEFKYLIK
ncbi:hypothetical protein BH11PSE11_BH11PSE11_12360 [soil metagenome]